MNPVNRALWFIESNFSRDITLDDIADVAGVSRYHMSRAFAVSIGTGSMRYMRGRRLTEAARARANGAPDILTVALDAGYNSHEAFTRTSGSRNRATASPTRPSWNAMARGSTRGPASVPSRSGSPRENFLADRRS
jgi:AraC-like DNA-binding protein